MRKVPGLSEKCWQKIDRLNRKNFTCCEATNLLINNLNLLPSSSKGIKAWWLKHLAPSRSNRKCFDFAVLDTGGIQVEHKTDRLLVHALRLALSDMLTHFPSLRDVWNSVAENGEPPTLSALIDKLLHIDKEMSRLTGFASGQASLSFHKAALDKEGLRYITDIGQIGSIREMTPVFRNREEDQSIVACCSCDKWMSISDKTNASKEQGTCVYCAHSAEGQEVSVTDTDSSYERMLSEQLIPQACSESDTDVINRLALLNQTTAEKVTTLISNEQCVTEPMMAFVSLDRCKFAEICMSACAEHQRMGNRNFPMTHNGEFSTCDLYQFYNQTEDVPENEREAIARDIIKGLANIEEHDRTNSQIISLPNLV